MIKLKRLSFQKHLLLNVKTGIIISCIFWIYLILRAYLVPILHDEVSTFWFFIQTGKFIPFTYIVEGTAANNHVLNSLLTQIFYKMFGYTPIVLRLANLLFVPMYCYFAYKIADALNNKYLSMLFWFCLLFIHSVSEFLALSRGYGMSFALLLGAVWYLIRALESGKTKDYLFSSLFITGAISANLSLISTDLIILSVLILNVFILNGKITSKPGKLAVIILAGAIPLAAFSAYSFEMQKAGALYYGQHQGFWIQTVSTLLKALFNSQSFLLRWGLILYFILFLFLSVWYLIRNFSFSVLRDSVLVFPLLLIGNIIAVLLLDYFFNVNFPEDRTGFYFYYFFVGSIFFLIDKAGKSNVNYKVAWVLIPFILIPIHFVFASNFTHCVIFRDDRIPKRFYTEIKMKSESMKELATIGSYKGRTLVLAYFNYLDNGNLVKSHDSDYPSLVPDFQVLKTEELPNWNLYYNAVDYDRITGYHLLERKNKLKRHIISETDTSSTHGFNRKEYFGLAKGTLNTLINNPLFFEYSMDIESPVTPFVAWVVVEVSDSTGKAKAYEYIPLNWMKPVWKGKSKHFHSGQLVTNLPPGTQKYLTYIWNLDKVPFSVSNVKVTVKRLDKD